MIDYEFANEFITENVNLIDENNFYEFYNKCPEGYRGSVTRALHDADIYPEEYLATLPMMFRVKDEFLKDYHIPSHIARLGDGCFFGCTNLKTIHIPFVQSIGRYCFRDCTDLEKIYFDGTVEQWRRLTNNDFEYIFYHCGDATVVCKDGSGKLNSKELRR